MRTFQDPWKEADEGEREQLLASGEIYSVANLNVIFETVQNIRPAPIMLVNVLAIAGATMAPMIIPVLAVYTPTDIAELIKNILS